MAKYFLTDVKKVACVFEMKGLGELCYFMGSKAMNSPLVSCCFAKIYGGYIKFSKHDSKHVKILMEILRKTKGAYDNGKRY